MAQQKKQPSTKSKPLHHTLREFLFAMSYWGSWTRALLFFMMISLMLALTLSGTEIGDAGESIWFTTFSISGILLYSVIFFLYDAVYVTLARRSSLHRQFDRLALFAAEAITVISIFALMFVYAGNVNVTSVYIAIFAALLLLPIRALLGLVARKN